MKKVVVAGSFDNPRSQHFRLLEEASRLGELTVCLWSDEAILRLEGQPSKFSLAERRYVLNAIRYVSAVIICPDAAADSLPEFGEIEPQTWVVDQAADNAVKRAFCAQRGIEYAIVSESSQKRFPDWQMPAPSGRKKVIVTGCFDWLHSGHVRFFEEAAGLGELYVGVGHDANLHLLKGPGHPLFPEDERRYLVQSIRHVHAALITSGRGWMDAEPEIERLGIDIYAVNDDGDKPEKRAFCEQRGLEYVVLKRLPRPGLPARQSTDLRGF